MNEPFRKWRAWGIKVTQAANESRMRVRRREAPRQPRSRSNVRVNCARERSDPRHDRSRDLPLTSWPVPRREALHGCQLKPSAPCLSASGQIDGGLHDRRQRELLVWHEPYEAMSNAVAREHDRRRRA